MPQVVPLDLMSVGEVGRIVDVAGDEPLVRRLAEMGLRVGARVRMQQTGRPCIVAVGDQRLSLRGDDELTILVQIGDGEP